jgi:PAS domain S-box-containing protein
MEKAVSATEYRLLVEHSPVMSWRAGLDAKCNYFNATWLAFTGRTLEQEMGDGWSEGVHPDDFQNCVDFYLDHFARREAFEMEYRLRRHDGAYRWIFDRGAPYTDDAGEFAGFIGSCVDVHDRRTAEEAARLHNEEQISLARDFERWILAIVSHDIRNPLQAIAIAAHSIRKIPDTSGFAHLNADVITRGAKRIQHIVGDLLDLSCVRDGTGLFVEAKPADLHAICRQAIDELASVARGREIIFDCDVDGFGDWDEHRILQAVSNLTTNAVKHGTPGTPVHVRVTGDADQVAVEVRNQGSIPRELLPHIFDPFRSGHHHGSRGEGLGLGLFIVKAIAGAHGGGVEVDAREGDTSFRLVLPRRPKAENAARA